MTITRLAQAGFEMQTLVEAPAANPGNAPTISSTKAFTGTYSLKFAGGSSPEAGRGFPVNTSELRSAHMLNHAGVTTSTAGMRGGNIIQLACEDATIHDVNIPEGAATIDLRIDGVVQDSIAWVGSPIAAEDTWHDLSINAKIDATNGWVKFYKGGVLLLSFEGDTGNSPITSVIANGTAHDASNGLWNASLYIDDFYVDDMTGEDDDGPAPLRRFNWFAANGNGDASEMMGSDADQTDNYLLVDDGVPDDDTTYVFADAADLQELYTHVSVSVPEGYAIEALISTALARRTDADIASTLQMQIKKGSVSETAALTMPTTYGVLFGRFTALPDASELNPTNIDATQIGFESAGVYA